MMALKHTKCTANVASKRPPQVIDLETELKVIEDYESGRSMIVTAHRSGMSHSTISKILKNKVMEAVKGSTSQNTTKLINI